ncbi:unnamed protein product [Caenorhabditis brenneri]
MLVYSFWADAFENLRNKYRILKMNSSQQQEDPDLVEAFRSGKLSMPSYVQCVWDILYVTAHLAYYIFFVSICAYLRIQYQKSSSSCGIEIHIIYSSFFLFFTLKALLFCFKNVLLLRSIRQNLKRFSDVMI